MNAKQPLKPTFSVPYNVADLATQDRASYSYEHIMMFFSPSSTTH